MTGGVYFESALIIFIAFPADLYSGNTLCVTNESGQFNYFGIKIAFPESSLPDGIDKCVLRISFNSSADLEIPPDCELTSAIYHVECQPNVTFKKAFTLELQHCVNVESDNCNRLVIAKATRKSQKFEVLNEGTFPVGSFYGSIQLFSFSWFSVLWSCFGNWRANRMYCALLFCRKNINKIDIKCVLCWNLHTHVQVRTSYYTCMHAVFIVQPTLWLL